MTKPWFDAKTGTILLDEYVTEMPSFRRIMADEVITANEVREQAERTITLLKQLEVMLAPETRQIATEALCELAVLYALHRGMQDNPR
jgi:hypothetical protein